MDLNKDIAKIILEREDGTQEIITKGFVADYTVSSDGKEGTVAVDMCGMGGKDLQMIILSMVELGFKLGIIDPNQDGEEEEDA